MKIVIMGLGIYKKGSGITAAKFFIKKGDEVVITDLKKASELKHQIDELELFCKKHNKKMPALYLGGHKKNYFKGADIVVRNPGVPKDSEFLRFAKRSGAQIEIDISIFMKNCLARVIGITGTRGKSTTTTLIYKILKSTGKKAWLGGNIKISPLSFIEKIKPKDIVVLELSSWMLENFNEYKLAPHIAVVTNIYPDHLNTYKNMAEYVSAKKNIFKNQKKQDYLVVNGENAKTKRWKAPGKTIYFYKKDAKDIKDIKLKGEHNLENISAALAVCKIMKVPKQNIKKVLKNFDGLSDRQEVVAKRDGIIYVNDTTATTPDGAIAALHTFGKATILTKKRIVLICGGKDKGLEYDKLAREIKKYCKGVILLPGSATKKLKSILHTANFMLQEAKTMNEAISRAKKIAVKGDIILLSPAAASFGLFQNEFDRGEKFKKAI